MTHQLALVPRDEAARGRVRDIFERYRGLIREASALQRRLDFQIIKGGKNGQS